MRRIYSISLVAVVLGVVVASVLYQHAVAESSSTALPPMALTATNTCSIKETRVRALAELYAVRLNRQADRYRVVDAELHKALTKAENHSLNTTQFASDITVFEQQTTAFQSAGTILTADINGLSSSVCSDTTSAELAVSLQPIHAQLAIVRDAIAAKASFYQITIKPDIQSLLKQAAHK
jgi:hypothetical protein